MKCESSVLCCGIVEYPNVVPVTDSGNIVSIEYRFHWGVTCDSLCARSRNGFPRGGSADYCRELY
nr:MAG TPA: hypothetical protein [Caudoviricetes sp.]